MNEQSIRQFVEKLGTSKTGTSIYLHLIYQGPKSISRLETESKYSRYILQKEISILLKKNLITKDDSGKTVVYSVKSVHTLKDLLKEKQEKLKKTSVALDDTIEFLEKSFHRVEKKSKIVHYSGINGLQQIVWNSQKAQGTLRLFQVEELSQFLNFGFYDTVREIYLKNNIRYLELSNEDDVEGWTDIEEFINIWEIRYIDPKSLI